MDNLLMTPSLSLTEGYVERKIGGRTETEIYDHAITTQQNVLIEGEAGTGKTTSAMRYASKRGLPFYSVSCNAGVEGSHLFGKLIPNDEGNFSWQDGGLTQVWRYGGVAILDEINFLNTKIQPTLNACLDERGHLTLLDHKGEIIERHPNTLVIGTYNAGYRGTGKFNEAFSDRFRIKLVFEYDVKIEQKFIPSPSLLNLAKQMRADAINGLYETPISTRLLKNFVALTNGLGYDFAVESFLNAFNDDERASVKLLLEAHRYDIAKELGVTTKEIITDTNEQE
jgi:MoxR-like ATPase